MIRGITFVNQKVKAADHGAVFERVLTDGHLYGTGMSRDGKTLHIKAGLLVIKGRLIELVDDVDLTLEGTSGYARVKLVIDTGAVSTADSFEQVSVTADYASTLTGFSELTQQNINQIESGVYEAELAVYALTYNGIGNRVRRTAPAHAVPQQIEVTLLQSGWKNNTQTVAVELLKEADQPLVTWKPGYYSSYVDCGIRATSVGDGTLTFACDEAPTKDLVALVRL